MEDLTIGVIGLGYVGLPIAQALSKKYKVTGFDINQARIEELRDGIDITEQFSREQLLHKSLTLTADENDLTPCNIYIVTVPTPLKENQLPDLSLLEKASELVGRHLRKGDIVVYESTVYPGVTEEICCPILEKVSALKLNTDFSLGYSPERINPGDTVNTFESITKVVSASNADALATINQMYLAAVHETYQAASIKVAEAAKVIENTQRDINIALMNELAIIFKKMDISTKEVLSAAQTKWNFLKFEPGFVGGHCIGIDPYYLTYKAQNLGYQPEVILAGRRINDTMAEHVATLIIKQLAQHKISLHQARVGILGVTFKENCPDLRNSKVFDLIASMQEYGVQILAYDPVASGKEALAEYNTALVDAEQLVNLDAVIVCNKHEEFLNYNADTFKGMLKNPRLLFDPKSIFNKDELEQHELQVWQL